MPPAPDPYVTLGVRRSASEPEIRAAYRRLVQRHHPDHNNGSAQSARRFEEVQEAYAAVGRMRERSGPSRPPAAARPDGRPSRSDDHAEPSGDGPAPSGNCPTPPGDSRFDARLAEMERELSAARAAREKAARQAREKAAREARRAAARAAGSSAADRQGGADRDRPSDEELGYVSTDDSFAKIFDDLASEVSSRLSEARDAPATHRVADLIDELGSKLAGEPPKGE